MTSHCKVQWCRDLSRGKMKITCLNNSSWYWCDTVVDARKYISKIPSSSFSFLLRNHRIAGLPRNCYSKRDTFVTFAAMRHASTSKKGKQCMDMDWLIWIQEKKKKTDRTHSTVSCWLVTLPHWLPVTWTPSAVSFLVGWACKNIKSWSRPPGNPCATSLHHGTAPFVLWLENKFRSQQRLSKVFLLFEMGC
jgi:hypothetical protein